MVERICPACHYGNPLADRYCGKCGTPLERQELARRSDGALTIAGKQLPVTWRQVGRTAAIGAAALAAEVGLAWLRHKVDSSAPTNQLARAVTSRSTPAKSASGTLTTIVSQRILEIFQSDDGHVHVNDRHVWQRKDE